MATLQEEKNNKELKKNQKIIDFLTDEKKKIREQNKELLRKKKINVKIERR